MTTTQPQHSNVTILPGNNTIIGTTIPANTIANSGSLWIKEWPKRTRRGKRLVIILKDGSQVRPKYKPGHYDNEWVVWLNGLAVGKVWKSDPDKEPDVNYWVSECPNGHRFKYCGTRRHATQLLLEYLHYDTEVITNDYDK